jgi:hypothetical protein
MPPRRLGGPALLGRVPSRRHLSPRGTGTRSGCRGLTVTWRGLLVAAQGMQARLEGPDTPPMPMGAIGRAGSFEH